MAAGGSAEGLPFHTVAAAAGCADSVLFSGGVPWQTVACAALRRRSSRCGEFPFGHRFPAGLSGCVCEAFLLPGHWFVSSKAWLTPAVLLSSRSFCVLLPFHTVAAAAGRADSVLFSGGVPWQTVACAALRRRSSRCGEFPFGHRFPAGLSGCVCEAFLLPGHWFVSSKAWLTPAVLLSSAQHASRHTALRRSAARRRASIAHVIN